MPYVPGMEVVVVKGVLAIKGALASAGGHVVAQQAGQEAIKAGVAGIAKGGLAYGAKTAAASGAGTLMTGGAMATAAEVADKAMAKKKKKGKKKH